MIAHDPLPRIELAQHRRELRIEDRAYARAQQRATADPCQTYRCTCGNVQTALQVAWWGTDCDCGSALIGSVQLTNPTFPPAIVTLQTGPK